MVSDTVLCGVCWSTEHASGRADAESRDWSGRGSGVYCLPACLLARLLAAEWAGIGSKRGQMERKVREDVGLFEGRCR